MSLLRLTSSGWYCPQGDFYVDPTRPVSKAVITHAHADHAKMGSQHYLCTPLTAKLLEQRWEQTMEAQTPEYGQVTVVNGVRVSFHPAGHVPGSAQVRLEYKGEVTVITGDYKLEDDGLSTPFEPISCHTFISESTFALPVFQWQRQEVVIQQMLQWHQENTQKGMASLVHAYSLGKAQRLIVQLAPFVDRIWVHPAVAQLNPLILPTEMQQKVCLAEAGNIPASEAKDAFIIAPPTGKIHTGKTPCKQAFASGWMAVRGIKRRDNVDQGFVISDHADWPALLQACQQSQAEQVVLTHGYKDTLAQYLTENGQAACVDTDLML